MAKETFILKSISQPEFEHLDDDIFCTSLKIKKGTAADWQDRFNAANLSGESVTLQFPARLGYQLEAPILALSVAEYDESHSSDILDVYVRLSTEQLLQIIPPEISTEFGY